jgi:hypothetical protein
MPQSHYKITAKFPNELIVRGDYAEIAIGRIDLNAEVRLDRYAEDVESYTLFEAVYSNLWDHVISTNMRDPLLIDSKGFQHAACCLQAGDPFIQKSKCIEEDAELPSIADEIQGKARSAGWIAFPKLKKTIVPHRLIFHFFVFDPGYTSGEVKHSETLELIFDLSLFGHLLGQEKNRKM